MENLSRELLDPDFDTFVGYAYRLAGIKMDNSKRHLIISRLIRRVRALNLSSLNEYRGYLENHLKAEQGNFVNAITTNLTSFFRERHHFDYLRDWAVSEHTSDIRIWSAGCSTGQEPYSIALTMADCGATPRCTIKATDIDTQCLVKAKLGEYKMEDVEGLDKQTLKRHFLCGEGVNAGKVKVSSAIQNSVTFEQLNLIESWPQEAKYHVIFCRNVFIYFDAPTQQKLLKKFADQLHYGGILFLGHSETQKQSDGSFVMEGRTTFRRSQS